MKKAPALLLALALCFGMVACSSNTPADQPEGTTAPAESVPEGSAPEQTDPTEETVFDITTEPTEEGLFKEVVHSPYSEATLYSDGIFGGIVWRHEAYPDGTHRYENYHENGFPYVTAYVDAEGNCTQTHHLDNGYRGDGGLHLGTVVYQKTQRTDGSFEEYLYDDEGNRLSTNSKEPDGSTSVITYDKNGDPLSACHTAADGSRTEESYYSGGLLCSSITEGANGSFQESHYYENGNAKSFREERADGSSYEAEYLENGTCIRSVSNDAAGGVYSEAEYNADGSQKYSKYCTADSTLEQKWDEQGYCTYYFYSDSAQTVEATADETGKLVKVTENGTVFEDAAALADFAALYGFAADPA